MSRCWRATAAASPIAARRLNELPLGAAALAGTAFPIDRKATAKALGFDRPAANSLDAVSDRDFALEALAAASICAVHLSRFAEEIVLWCSAQFGFVRFSDRFTTGSSIMPQKRNPDAAELVRAKTGRIVGALTALIVVMKGLPLAYSKDMQEDKEQLFDALPSLIAFARRDDRHGRRHGARPRADARGRGRRLFDRDRPCRLAGARGRPPVPRRAPRHRSDRGGGGEARRARFRRCRSRRCSATHPKITAKVFDVLSVEASVASRASEGGTAPKNVRQAARAWLKRLAAEDRARTECVSALRYSRADGETVMPIRTLIIVLLALAALVRLRPARRP